MARGVSEMRKPKDAKGAIKRILGYLGQYGIVILFAVILSVVSNLLALQGPRLAGLAINEIDAGPGNVNLGAVSHFAMRMLLFYGIASIMTLIVNITITRVSRNVAKKMRSDIFSKLMKLPVSFFDRNSAGDIISRVSYDVDVISTCIATDVVQIMTSAVTVIGALVMMLTISPLMSVAVVLTVPVSIVFTAKMRKKTQPKYSQRSKNYGIMNGFVEEMFSGQKTIQSYAYEDTACNDFDRVNTDAADGFYNAESLGCTIGPTMAFITNTLLAIIGISGSLFYMRGVVSLGQISSFVLYSRKFSGPINEIANIINEIFSALSASERVFDLLDREEEAKDKEDAFVLSGVSGDVKLKDVSFGYNPDKIVLHNLNVDATPGKLVAIVGPTGAGKTTTINLLMRFYDVDSGEITVDGHPVKDVTRSSLRKSYAMVLQDTWVFEGTVFQNIAYGNPDASASDVVAAAKKARIHNFIMRMPDGYDTVLKEDGSNISKGQKQLLTIARAMLYDSSMLILDEATSNVDTSTEREIQSSMRDLMRDRTCFVIAHRLSTIRNADVILVMNHGDVIEKGTHESLMQSKGFYYNLYCSQFN